MEAERRRNPHRSTASDRFLSPFSSPDSGDPSSAGVELDEGDLFSTGTESPEPARSPRPPQPSICNISRSPLLLSRSIGGGFRRIHEKNSGVLAALPEEETKIHLLQRKPSVSLSSSPSTSPSPSSSSSFRLIPSIPTPKSDQVYHQSAPVNVPVIPRRLRRGGDKQEEKEDEDEEEEEEEEEMLPPHEIVARASGRRSPLTTFSVLEGAGRTLKGRDLRRVRNAVWRRTGFLD